MTVLPPTETERMASLTQIASLERTIYNVQDRRNLFANIWKTFMGSSEDLKLKKLELHIVKTPKWRLHFRNKPFSTRGCDI